MASNKKHFKAFNAVYSDAISAKENRETVSSVPRLKVNFHCVE